ncbi:MAG: pyruvate kinase alpha/beta domain-containing protein [Candidatus Bathyarchaeia archaeon]|jgi:hypothetical protein
MSARKMVLYFSGPGEVNSAETLKAAKERADELNIRDVVVASTRGTTGLMAVDLFKGYNVVVVSHVAGMKEPNTSELDDRFAEKIRAQGGKIVTAAHTFSGVNRAIQTKFNTVYPAGIIAQTLRLFGQGMKVVVEITAMAADAGAIPTGKDVIAIAGSGKGADTAVVIKSASSHNLFDCIVREIIAKPSST